MTDQTIKMAAAILEQLLIADFRVSGGGAKALDRIACVRDIRAGLFNPVGAKEQIETLHRKVAEQNAEIDRLMK